MAMITNETYSNEISKASIPGAGAGYIGAEPSFVGGSLSAPVRLADDAVGGLSGGRLPLKA
jgi:hypothetical protein